MFSDPFTTYRDVASGSAVTETWSRISLQGNSALYLKTVPGTNLPKYLRVSHAVAGSGKAKRDRRLAQFQFPQVVDGAETGLMATFSIIADIPQIGMTTGQTDFGLRFLAGLLRMASSDVAYGTNPALFWDKFLRGEA